MKAALALLALLFVHGRADPLPEVAYGAPAVCNPVTRTSIVHNVVPTIVAQPFKIDQTRMHTVHAVATALVAVTTTLQRVEQRESVVPVVSTLISTRILQSVQVQNVPVQGPAVTRQFTATALRVQTRVNNQIVTSVHKAAQPVYVTKTQFNTQYAQRFNTQTRVVTSQIAGQNAQRNVYRTQIATSVVQVPAAAVTSQVNTVVVNTQQVPQFITPAAATRTQVVQREVVQTRFQNVVNTVPAVATQAAYNTQNVQVTRTVVNTVTSTKLLNQVVVRTSVVNRVVTQTVAVPQVIVQTSIVNRVNNQVVTRTVHNNVVQTQTVQAPNRVQQRVVTSYVQSTHFVNNNVAPAQPQTVVYTVTRACANRKY